MEKIDPKIKIIPFNIYSIIKDVKNDLKKIYGNRIKDFILFGSYARGDFTEDSDIDILLVLNNMNDACKEIKSYSLLISNYSLKYDKVISVLPYDSNNFNHLKYPIILNVKKEGMRI